MRENIRMFLNWYRVAKPSKKYFFIAFITVLGASICSIIEPIFAANVITNINLGKYNLVYLFLTIGFLFIVLRKGFWDINYRIYYKLLRHTYMNLEEKIFDKIANAKNVNFEKNSKEKLINIIHNDVYNVANFADLLATRTARLLRLILTIGAIFLINIPVACVIILVDILNFFILNWINNRIAKSNKRISEAHDVQYESFSEVMDSKDIMKDLNVTGQVKRKFLNSCNGYIKEKNQWNIDYCFLDQYFHVFYQFVIYAMTIFIVYMVSKGEVSLTLYFLIVPYLSSGIEVANDFMTILTEIKKANISTNRVSIILNFTEKELLELGNNKTDDILGNIDFKNVSYNSISQEEHNSRIKDISFHIPENETVLFLGQRNCGKRTIFNLLRREMKQDQGDIYVDGINIWDYTEKVHKTNVNYLTTKPYFFHGSIMKNLEMVCRDKQKIKEVCNMLELYDYILTLPKKYRTDINNLPEGKKYLVGLARTLLTNSEIIILYEFPIALSKTEKDSIKHALDKLYGKRTILIFSASEECINLVSQVIKIERGTIESISKKKKR